MEDWFTVEQIDADTLVVSEYEHWEQTHCYLLISAGEALLIDTGMGIGDIGALVRSLTAAPVRIVTTHAHWDHIGGHNFFAHVSVHEAEAHWLAGSFPLPLEAVKKNLRAQPCDFPADFSTDKYAIYNGGADTLLHDGDMIRVGKRNLRVLHTPGHSPGHICLYEQARQYLYSGDLVYAGCLDAFYPSTDPLLFRRSIKKLLNLPVQRILPGHHRLDISSALIAAIDAGFEQIFLADKLKHGGGIFDFGEFQIHI